MVGDIRERLKANELSQNWLIRRLALSGIGTDKTELSAVLSGKRSGDKANAIRERSNEIIDEYERLFASN